MSRTARQKSKTDIYHVILRGINRQRIFEDEEDYERFLFLLSHYREVSGYSLYTWCLMPNHIHILLKEGEEPLQKIFRRIGASFVYWYNMKYGRTGHLFQDRFKSEAVEDDTYFLTALRYIHRNPVKAGICSLPEDYPYSSYSSYFDSSMIDSAFVLGMISRDDFTAFHKEGLNDSCMEVSEPQHHLTDNQLKALMKEQWQIDDISEFQMLPDDARVSVLQALLQAGGSIRQISRLTGVSFGIVRKYA